MKMRALIAAFAVVVQVQAVHAQSRPSSPPAPQVAQVPATAGSAAADLTTATFGDWQLRCRAAVAASANQPAVPRTCEVIQSVIIQGQSAPFAQLAFGKPTPKDPVHLTTVLPTNIAFPSTVKIAVDEKDKQPVELPWTRCLPGGCFASIATRDDFLKRWRALEEGGRFIFKNGAGQEIIMPFSFRGLARALDALAKEG